MLNRNSIRPQAFAVVTVALIANATLSKVSLAASKINVDGKIVIANVEKHTASIRIAKIKRDIKSRKASVLSPKRFPVTIDLWNGKKGQPAWVPQKIEAAGVYTVRYLNGEWKLTRRQAVKTPSTARPSTQSTPARTQGVARSTSRQPSYRRTTGSPSRVVRRSGRPYFGGRVPVVRRVCGSLLWLYRFVEDEADRELIRDLIIGREIDDAIEEDLWDRLDGLAVNLPAVDRLGFDRALRDLRDLNEQDLKDLEGATDEEWDQVRDELGDQITDNAWREIESDYAGIDVETLPAEEVDSLDEIGIDELESNIDIDDLEGNDAVLGDLAGTLDDVDVGDLGGGVEDIDISDIDAGFGLDGGGADLGSGTFDHPGGGAGFDYDNGGFRRFRQQHGWRRVWRR
jgi:hypothetical protein